MKMNALLIGLIFFISILAGTLNAASEQILLLDFILTKDDAVTLNDMRIEIGTVSEAADSGGYSVSVFSSSGIVLYTHYFDAAFTAYADPVDPDKGFPMMPGQEDAIGEYGEVALDEINLVIKMPYSTDVSSYQIKKGDSVLLEGSVDVCNENGKCEPNRGENYLSCEADCPSGSSDLYCDGIFDSVCDVDCKNQGREEMDTDCTCGNGVCDLREDSFYCPKDCGKPSNPFLKWVVIILFVIVIFIAGIIFLIVKIKKGKSNIKRASRKTRK
jgi:hypothetical protein